VLARTTDPKEGDKKVLQGKGRKKERLSWQADRISRLREGD